MMISMRVVPITTCWSIFPPKMHCKENESERSLLLLLLLLLVLVKKMGNIIIQTSIFHNTINIGVLF